MKISPEPLHPMRAWRELWQAEPLHHHLIREQAAVAAPPWKEAKRSGFHWLSHLLNRESSR